MKYKKRPLGISLLIAAIFVLTSIFCSCASRTVNLGEEEPFAVTITEQKITRTRTEDGGEELRLELDVSIGNATEEDFSKVWFELALNPEARSVIASQIITYSSKQSMEYFYVTTLEKASGPNQEDAQFAGDGSLMVSGFQHGWNTLLGLTQNPEQVIRALQTLIVDIHWEGGSQHEELPLSVIYKDETE